MNNELKAALVKIANQDLAVARRQGAVIVAQTKIGNLEVKYVDGTYSITNLNSGVALVTGKAAAARTCLVESYDLVAG